MADGKLLPPAGYAFDPAEHELITKFLRPRIADAFFASRLIHEFDAYSAAPGDLVEMYQHAQGTDKGDGKGASGTSSPLPVVTRPKAAAVAGGGSAPWPTRARVTTGTRRRAGSPC